jgi:anthranilate phosphoribosyltransferase
MSEQQIRMLDRLLTGEDLSETEAGDVLRSIANGDIAPALAGGLLAALRSKGESASEIRGFASALRELARVPAITPGEAYVDIVGTGGDGSGSLNLSTGSALLAAACDLKVVKHGNRSISSRCGSADVLQALGLPIPLDERRAGQCLTDVGFTFLFAPHYHPAMKNIAPVRSALGVRTIFNILGPLVNPASPPFYVIGAFSEAMAELMAETLRGMPIERAFVVHGAQGWDEATPIGPFVCFDVHRGANTRSVRDPQDLGIARCAPEALLGADSAHNAQRLEEALRGGDSVAHRDALALGAALALEVTGAAKDFPAAIERAREGIRSGAAGALLGALAEFGTRETP